MKVLWCTWKDRRNPRAGGAELVNEELAKRLEAAGHEVRFIVAGFAGAAGEEERDGFRVTRLGNRWTVYWHAFRKYRKSLAGWADVVIDEVNTMPFFCKFYVKKKNVLLVYQLCREVWFREMPFPLGAIGYLLEPLYLRLLNDRHVLTISESTKKDLLGHGFRADRVVVLPLGIDVPPVRDVHDVRKTDAPTVLCLGSIRPMKRTMHAIRAFEIARKVLPDLRLVVAGDASGSYGRKVLRAVAASPAKDAIRYVGMVDTATKIRLMREAHILCVPSVKEGWGLTVSEAAAQGTPTVVYDVDGLRDSVQGGETGVIAKDGDPAALATAILGLLGDRDAYERMRERAWRSASALSFDRTYAEFFSFLNAK